MDESFDEEAEQKLQEYDIKIIEYEDDITNLTENMQNAKLEVNDLQISNQKLAKRVEELNSIISNISQGTNETVENFLKNYKRTNELSHKNHELQEEISHKNDEIESLKNSSSHARDFISEREDHKSNNSRDASSHPEFDANELSLNGSMNNKTMERTEENMIMRTKLARLEEELMDLQNLNNIIMGQNQKLKSEVKELDEKLFNSISIHESKEDGKI